MSPTAKPKGDASKIPAAANPLADEPTKIASNINYHANFSPHFSPFKFEPEQAYYATAESVRDRLIQVSNCLISQSRHLIRSVEN
jgi:starch phosphorylase